MEMQRDPFTNDFLYEFWDGVYRCLHKFKCDILNETTAFDDTYT